MALITLEFGSQVLNMGERLNIILPDNFNESDPVENNQKKFPVLYLLHGYLGNNSDWIRLSSIERYASDHHIAVVMPSAYNSYYTNGLNGLNYFDYIANEVPEIASRLLPLSKDPKYNYIAGLSMGGYGAMKIGLTYPERFSLVASLSGALDIQFIYDMSMQDGARNAHFKSIFGENVDFTNSTNSLLYLANKLDKNIPFIYVNCGNEDFLIESNKKFVKHLDSIKVPYLYETYPGSHTWEYWDTHIQNIINQIDSIKLN
ncbi:MAG: alpha/beta hydrolase [Candidatus Izemoplasmatales bacterium]